MEAQGPLGSSNLDAELRLELDALASAGRLRNVQGRPKGLVDFTSNDYLGLASHELVIEAAQEANARYGAGGRAARLLGGGASHSELENLGAEWLGEQAALFFPTGYQANLGLLTSLAGEGDVVLSAAANHASIIDGVRLCKAKRYRYANSDMGELEQALKASADARYRLIATDGVFSMDGIVARLDRVCALAERHGAAVMVDDSHAVGFMGATRAHVEVFGHLLGGCFVDLAVDVGL